MRPADPAQVVAMSMLGAAVDGPVVRRQVGARLSAADGTEWLDAAGGGFGPGHPAVTARIAAQLRRVALSSRVFVSRPLAEAVTALDALAPGPLTMSYLCNSGAEALDAALKLAKGSHPERRRMLGLRGADHGSLSHGLALTLGSGLSADAPLQPVGVPADRAAELADLVDDSVAAVVLAPAAPGRALADLPPSWWHRLRAACDAADVLLVVDERTTGPARVGAGLASDLLPVLPDAVVLGETIGADAVPVGCMITTAARYDRVYGRRNPTVQGSTFGANPLSAAAVTAVLAVVRDEDLPARQRAVATEAVRTLGGLADPHGPVRAVGADGSLIWLRTDSAETAASLALGLARERVLVRRPTGPVLAVLPPLTADPPDVTTLLDRVAAAAGRLTPQAVTR
ncbi:aminotransferase class III-fold pyridoxal phosphate-dependent enzyme [Micromonospora sp. R77]|uniref:aminotransferase class III-fold pyridoxal phosphate-dependent enzyme n=1 Tax=Micromonospora sp. R77 TaxID=2925836 RepID=UPI001F61BC0E|nr:aminotransferase class III-fold pyridoxal phosphate-dependent enzyme [Micromonospora sp. R77]MCI4061259.1 aminotransferase class III-fold pyridoxal phosphate-dependent enzyme [Micromonospora sp. R77]